MADIDAALLADLLKESIQQGHRPHLTITSNSMAPLLQQGDQVCLGPITLEQIQLGDIITIHTGTDLLTHRYWGYVRDTDQMIYLVTRGDRPLTFDTVWPISQLVGHVITRCRQTQELDLTTGLGSWLNHRLAWLATAELRRLIPTWPKTQWHSVAQIAQLNQEIQKQQDNRWRQLSRHFWWWGARALTRMSSFIIHWRG